MIWSSQDHLFESLAVLEAPAMQQELKAEIAHHFACGGDTETPSNCE